MFGVTMITIDNLKHFVAVVENKGVIRAAEKIFISASSITRSIQQIEGALDKPLFDRISRNVQLNQEGARFYEKARLLVDQFGLLLNEDKSEGKISGHYRIGASHFLCESIISDLVHKLVTKFDKITIEIFSFDSHVLIKRIHEGEVDLGFSFSPKPSEATEVKKIYGGQLRLCVSKQHPLAMMPFSQVRKEISSYPAIIHRPSESIERCDNHPMFSKFKIVPNIQVYWDSDYFALGLLKQSQSWSMLPDYVINRSKDIVALTHPDDWEAPYEIGIVWNKRKSVSDIRDAVLDLL